MAKPLTSIVAHHDPSPTYFTLTGDELGSLENCARNPAREYALFCLGLFLPTLANLGPDLLKKPFEVTPTLFLNAVVAVCTLLIGAFQAINWWRTRVAFRGVMKRLREKPLMNLSITSVQTPQAINPPEKAEPQVVAHPAMLGS